MGARDLHDGRGLSANRRGGLVLDAFIGEGGRYDMLFDLGERLVRVQCKWAPLRGDVIVIRCYSSRRNCDGLLRRKYVPGEIDAFAAYCDDLRRCYFLPYERFSGRTEVHLRVRETKNRQKLGINWASDFEFAARLSDVPGAIAQLGERVHGMHEVAGSSPAGSMTDAARAAEIITGRGTPNAAV